MKLIEITASIGSLILTVFTWIAAGIMMLPTLLLTIVITLAAFIPIILLLGACGLLFMVM